MKRLMSSIFILAVLFTGQVNAQSSFWRSAKAYLGQTPPDETPAIFAPGILTTGGGFFPMSRIAFSNDGKEIVYVSNTSWSSAVDLNIKSIIFKNGQWEAPKVINRGYGAPSFSADNQTLYFQGPRIGERRAAYFSKKTDTGWSAPAVLITRPYGLYNIMPTASGRFYVGSNGNQGSATDFTTYDICTIPADLNDSSITSLSVPVNTNAFEGDLFIAPDESYLIFSSKETPTYESELWISFRKTDKTWTIPLSLGDTINKGAAHRFGQYVSPDNKYLFFTMGTSEKDCNIYWMRFDRLLKRLKSEAFRS